MNTRQLCSKAEARKTFSKTEESMRLTWESIAKAFPGLVPELQPALVKVRANEPGRSGHRRLDRR